MDPPRTRYCGSVLIDLNVGALHEPVTGRWWSPADVRGRTGARAAFLAAQGVAPGDRVFLHHGNTLEFFADLLAVWRLGACAIPVDPRLTAFELETLATSARPRVSVWRENPSAEIVAALNRAGTVCVPADGNGAASLPPPAYTLDDDALILFTSGTTGQPKGVVHTHRSLRAQWMGLRRHLGLGAYRRTLCTLPSHFGHGLICNSLFPWLAGQDLYITPPFKPELVTQLGRMIDAHGITFLSSVPAMWRLALKTSSPPTGRTLARVTCGSAPLSGGLWGDVQRWTGTHDVWNAYGITETASWLAGTSVSGFAPEDGLIGEAWGGVVRVLKSRDPSVPPDDAEACAPGESGHVWVSTAALMRGYLDRDDLTHAVVSGGWFVTGDIGTLDDRGWLYLRGREREEINKGGIKVYPGDVDAVAERFEHALDVCTFAIDDALQGEDVALAIVLRQRDDEALRALHTWMAHHLAVHQMPRRWYVMDEIPRTSRGKVNRKDIAAACAALKPVDMARISRGTA